MAIAILPGITFFGLEFKLPIKTKLRCKYAQGRPSIQIFNKCIYIFLEKNDTMTHSTNDTRGGDGRRLDRGKT